MKEHRNWFITIVVMVITVSILHYVTSNRLETDHVIFTKLYYIPVTIAALIYGLRGGLIAAVIVTLIYGPWLALRNFGPRPLLLDFALDLALLFGVGVLVGVVMDREREQHKRAQERERLASLGEAAAMMAHEMKSPLIAIGGFARMLLRMEDQDAGRREKLEVIKVESARLERLVHDALDFARFEPVEMECRRAGELLERTRVVVGPIAGMRGVKLSASCDSPELGVMCDLERMVQVLFNLVDNAVHYTREGGSVTLKMSATPARSLRVEVRDSGRGIPADLLENLFQPFAGRREGGSGLGLAIAQRIVLAHGGRIIAENLPEGGASFRFEIAGCEEPPRGKT
jgi:two-component system sensor histidine kinase HydH